ncbi:MAG: type II 3-dehydroquinate dehydratase [Flavobacteriaceae bacterium]
MEINIINGPNLNLLGIREPEIYGFSNFDDYLKTLRKSFPKINFDYFQSNIEGEIIDRLHYVGFKSDGIILNAAAYTHTSVGIGDAVKAIKTKVVEVHVSNIFSREDFRHNSFITPHAKGVITGFGLNSYYLAVNSFILKNL